LVSTISVISYFKCRHFLRLFIAYLLLLLIFNSAHFFFISATNIVSIKDTESDTKIIVQCDIKYTMTLSIKELTSVLMVWYTIITSNGQMVGISKGTNSAPFITDLSIWYQRVNQNPYVKELHTTQWPNKKGKRNRVNRWFYAAFG
jgi:hypothetical protein